MSGKRNTPSEVLEVDRAVWLDNETATALSPNEASVPYAGSVKSTLKH